MTAEYRKALTELDIILNYMNIQNLKKLPSKLTNFIKNNKDNDYNPNFNKNVPLHQLKLKRDTKILLSLFYRNYWCNEETKLRLLREDSEHKKMYEKELREKYNSDNLFKNKIQTIDKQSQSVQQKVALIEVKENLFTKFIKKLKNIFHIK